jgi:hypothetical protein
MREGKAEEHVARRYVTVMGLLVAIGLLCTHASFADEVREADEAQKAGEVQECLKGQLPMVLSGLRLAPVPLNFRRTNILLAGLGSYIVNAQGGCNDCHTNPPYARGGAPFEGEPERINAAGYMAGGQEFGPFVSRTSQRRLQGRRACSQGHGQIRTRTPRRVTAQGRYPRASQR